MDLEFVLCLQLSRNPAMPHWKSVESPRKRGRPLTYEEKWMVYYAFESFERNKAEGSVIVIEDPYAVTSSYIGVSRTTVANIVKSVRERGRVPQLRFPGNRNQMTAIPVLGCPNRPLPLDRFLDSRCQSRLFQAWWHSIFNEKGGVQTR
jgi:hypothetical protein